MRKILAARTVTTDRGVVGDSILIVDGRVAAIGTLTDFDGSGIEVTEYDATIIPGLRDAHTHPVAYTALLAGCSLKNATDMKDLQRRLVAYAGTLSDGQPVVATRFDDASLAENRLPTRSDLDAAIPNRPAVVYRYCGHVAVANTAALHASGITGNTQAPSGGSIDHDDAGNPTGVLRETAMGLIPPSLAWSGNPDEGSLLSALVGLAGAGITSIGAMIGHGDHPTEGRELELWRQVATKLPIRVHGIASVDSASSLEEAANGLSDAGPRLNWLGVKRFADGSLGGHTAAMHAPFADDPSVGILRLSDMDTNLARRSLKLGGMVAIHAIGDRAIDGVLDIFEELISEGADPRDLRMEHVSVINPTQVDRFARLGVTAVVQPAFLASESEWITRRIGAERIPWVYPFRSLLASNVPVAGSSDCPVEPPQALWGMAASMDRFGIAPDERLTGTAALAMFTSGAARALREPEPLATGSPADIAVIDADPATASADEIRDAQVLDTYIDGISVKVNRESPIWSD